MQGNMSSWGCRDAEHGLYSQGVCCSLVGERRHMSNHCKCPERELTSSWNFGAKMIFELGFEGWGGSRERECWEPEIM